MAKASTKVVFSTATRNRFWFGIIKKRVHHLLQLHDAGFGKAHAPLALEVEWLGDHANGENASSRAASAITGAAPCRYRRPCRR
jgi:hypothetical protein